MSPEWWWFRDQASLAHTTLPPGAAGSHCEDCRATTYISLSSVAQYEVSGSEEIFHCISGLGGCTQRSGE
ncbi:hypothetical protein FHG87_015125 [Trinorchestia longiramus]|nr:hypothetical protein FHG87_015125 [Trinorchestia longiramus]